MILFTYVRRDWNLQMRSVNYANMALKLLNCQLIVGRLIKKNLTWWIKHGTLNIKHSNHLRLFTLCLIRMEMCSKIVYSAFFNPFSRSVFFRERWYSLCVFPRKSKSRPSLLIKQRGKTTVLPLRWSLTRLVFRWRQRNLPKSVLHVQSFVLLITIAFCIFSFPSLSLSWLLNLANPFSI